MGTVTYLHDHNKKNRDWPRKLWREALGETIRQARKKRRDRLSDVAKRAGVSPQYLSEIERGIKDPSSEILHAISGALGLTTGEVARRAANRIDCAAGTPLAVLVA